MVEFEAGLAGEGDLEEEGGGGVRGWKGDGVDVAYADVGFGHVGEDEVFSEAAGGEERGGGWVEGAPEGVVGCAIWGC